MTHQIEEKDIDIKYAEKRNISDHVPIQVTIKHGEWEWKEV